MDIITTSLSFHTAKESTTQCNPCQSCTLFNQLDILSMNKISKAYYSKAQYKTIPYRKLRLGNQFFMSYLMLENFPYFNKCTCYITQSFPLISYVRF